MTFLPIVARELRVAARRRGTYWVRTGAAVLVLVLGTCCFLMMQDQPPRDVAPVLFGLMTGSAVLYCLLSGIRSTADCLSWEKREGTLGLLFLTDLKGYDIIAGKLAATSVNALYGVLAVVPMLAIPLLLGGIAPAEFGRMALVALNTLFFSLALGLCVSAMSRSARKAKAMTFLLLLVFTALLPVTGGLLMALRKTAAVPIFCLLPSAGFSYYGAWDIVYRPGGASGFWWSVGVIHGLSWLFLGFASVIAPRAWQERAAGAQSLRWRELWQLWGYGNLAERCAFRRRLLDKNAYFWLAARVRIKPALVWGTLALLACAWVWGLAKFRREWLNEGVYLMTALVLNLLIKGWFASEAGRQLAEERQQGALELLLSTPLSVRDILRGQFLALQRQFLGPLLAVLVAFLLCLLGTLTANLDAEMRAPWVCIYAAGMVMLVADLVGLYWVGMWQGLTVPNPNRATSAAGVRILALPWVGFAFVALVVSLLSISNHYSPGWKFFLGLWFGLGLLADAGFSAWARHKLLTEFRRAVEQRYLPQPGFWRRLLASREPWEKDLPPVIEVLK